MNDLHLRILRLVADRNQRELNNHDAADHVARLGWQPEVRFLGDLAARSFTLKPVQPSDLLRIAELVAHYRDLPLSTVDASVVAAAERLRITEIATVDRRHFSVVQPNHIDAFRAAPIVQTPASRLLCIRSATSISAPRDEKPASRGTRN